MLKKFTQDFFSHYEVNSTLDKIQKYDFLWKSVLSQAVIDAVSNCKKTESIVEKHRAIAWLSDLNQDFIDVCRLANYDPKYVQRKVQPTLMRNSQKKVS